MKTINIIKILGIIGLLFLLPSISNAQIQRVWSIAEYTSTILPPPATGTKVAYRTLNNSLYYWNGTAWVRIAGPGIVDTSYSLSFSSPTLSLLGSGSSVSLTNLYTAGYGLIKTAETWRADTTSPNGLATRKYTLLNPTSILADRLVRSNGSNLVAGNLSDNGTRLQALLPWQFQSWTTAGRPTGVNNYWGYNSTTDWLEGYLTSAGAWISPLQSSLTGGKGTAKSVVFLDANGRAAQNATNFVWDDTNKRLGIGVVSPTKLFTLFGQTGSQGFYIDKDPGDVNWWRLEKISGGNGFIRFSNADINVSDRLSLPTTGVATFRSGNQNPQISHFVNTNYRMYFSGGVGNANPGGGSDGGDLYFIGGDSGNTDSGITGGNVYIQGGQAHSKGAAFSGNVILNWGTWGLVGIRTTSPTRTMDVNGELRIRDVVTDAPTTLIGVDGDGDVGSFSLSGLSISSGTITSQNVYNTNGTIGANRLVTLTDSIKFLFSGQDVLKLKSNGVLYSTARSLTNSFIHSMEPNENYNNLTGNIYLSGSTSALDTTTGSRRNKYDASYFSGRNTVTGGVGSFFLAIAGYGNNHKTSTNSNSIFGLYNETIGSNGVIFGNFNTGGGSIFGYSNTNTGGGAVFGNGLNNASQNAYLYGSSSGRTQHFFGADDSDADSARLVVAANNSHVNTNLLLINPTSGKRFIDARATATEGSTRFFALKADGVIETIYGTGTKEASDLSKTQSNYIAGFATDGTLLDLGLGSSLKKSGGVLDVKNKSLIDSLPLASVTIDASANDLAINNLTNLDFNTEDGNGIIHMDDNAVTVESAVEITLATQGDALLTLTDEVYMYAPNADGINDFRINTSGFHYSFTNTDKVTDSAMTLFTDYDRGLLKLHKYGKDNHITTVTGEYSTRVAGITSNGLVQDYRLARDTFIEDVTLFSVGTLLYDCQELTIVSSMTALASTYQEIRFPDAADHLRGKKIIVYSKKRDGGTYVPYISVVGGVSRLYYTTNPAVGGTDPSSQATLYIDDGTWSDHGTTFEFTCLKIDNTPAYRWVLKQR